VVTTTTVGEVTYRVRSGDTLTGIARRYKVTVDAVIELNAIDQPDRLVEGQTLKIPPVPPLALVVTPREGEPGQDFQLELTGARPGERIRFEISKPNGTFTGPPHVATDDGVAAATYQTSLTDAPGRFTVIARGNQSTTTQASFELVAATGTT
jgi:LysM repeat protein